jgi:hypothetical protein
LTRSIALAGQNVKSYARRVATSSDETKLTSTLEFADCGRWVWL